MRVMLRVMKLSTQLSTNQLIAMVSITNPALRMVRHASQEEKYHLSPLCFASQWEARTPVTKSIAMNSKAHNITDFIGAKRAAKPRRAPLAYLYKASIDRAFLQDVVVGVVGGILRCVSLQVGG